MSAARKLRQRLFRTRPDDALPLTVEHQRIYILPTPRGCAFVGALLLMLVASINYDLSLGYALCFLLTGLFTSALLNTYRNMAGLCVHHIEASSGFAGDAVTFSPKLGAPAGRARHAIELVSPGASERATVTVVEATSTASAALSVPTTRRGHLPLGRLTLASTWPLGLWRAWSYVHSPVSATVWPRPENDAPPLPVIHGDGDGGNAHAHREGDVSGLRDWIPGDSPSRVAWKRVARGDELKVRLLEANHQPATTELALEATRLNALEAQLSRLTAWVLNAEHQGSDYSLQLPGTSIDADRGSTHRKHSLDALAVHGLGAP